MSIDPVLLETLCAPFFAEDPTRLLYTATCCGRIYVGPIAPTSCRTCTNIPEYRVVGPRGE